MTGNSLWSFVAFVQLFNSGGPQGECGGGDDEKMTTGCKIAVVGTIIWIVLCLVFESWLSFIFIAVASFIIGLNHDFYKSTEDNS